MNQLGDKGGGDADKREVGIGSKSGKACFKQEEPAPSDEDDAPADDTAAANATATGAKDSSGCGLLATAGALDTSLRPSAGAPFSLSSPKMTT